MPTDPTTLALTLAVVVLGAALQGAAGFGMALIAAPPLMILAPSSFRAHSSLPGWSLRAPWRFGTEGPSTFPGYAIR